MALHETSRPRAWTVAAAVTAACFALSLLGYRHNQRVLAAKSAADGATAYIQQSGPQASARHSGTPVLVELFTSEGCSDCPPADALLARLQQDQPVAGASIIALEEHVDYWDHLGWRDRFSSPDITVRQGEYTRRLHLDDNYTPQMIVDGTDQFVGSDSARALRSIAAAARRPKPVLVLSPVTLASGRLTASASVASPSPGAAFYAALVQPLSSTRVLRGENGGHTLQHVSTVLSLQKIGDARDASAPLGFSLSVPAGADPANLAVVVFEQQADQGAILAAGAAGIVR